MATLEDMHARIASELSQPALVSRIAPTVASAIEYYHQERFWWLEVEAFTDTIAGQENYAAPIDLLQLDTLTLTDATQRRALTQVTWDQFRANDVNQVVSRPQFFAFYRNEFWLRNPPDKVYRLTASYLRKLGPPSAGAENEWTTEAEELIRAKAKYDLLIMAEKFDAAAFAERTLTQALDNLVEKSHRRIRNKTLGVESTGGRSYNVDTDGGY